MHTILLAQKKLLFYNLLLNGAKGLPIALLSTSKAWEEKSSLEKNKPPPSTDFRPELSRIKHINVDSIFLIHAGADLVLALKQIKSLGINTHLLTTSESFDDTVIREAKDTANGLTFFIPKVKCKKCIYEKINGRISKK